MAYKPEPGDRGYHEFKATEAETEIAKIWTPKVRYLNLTGEPGAIERRLRIFADGTVETIVSGVPAPWFRLDVSSGIRLCN